METRTVQLNVQTNAATTQDEFKRLHQEIAKAEQEFEDLNNTLGETDAATVAAKQKVTDLRGAYQQLNQTTTDLDGTFEQVYGQLQPLTTRMGEAEDRLYELALAGKQATQEYKDLMAATQNYLRTQMQVDLQVEAGAMPMAQKLTMAVGGVAGAFSAAEGAIALFGVESQAMQQTLLRLNALLAITSGMMAIKEAIPVWQSMGVAAKTALAGIRTGVLATGIGALVIAVGSLVAFWDDIKIAISGAGAEQEKLAKNAKKKVEADKTALTVYEKQWELLKAQGKTEKEIAKLQLGKLNTMIKNAEIQVATAKKTRDAEVQSSKWWAKFWQGMWDASAGFLKGLFGGLDAIGQVLGEDFGLTKWLDETGKGFVKFFADPEAVKAEQDKIVAESEVYLLDLKIKYKEAENTISEVTKKEGEKRVETTQKTQKEQLDITRQLKDESLRIMEDGFDKEYAILKEKRKRDKEDAEKQFKEGVLKKEDYEKLLAQIDVSFEADRKKLYQQSFNDNLKQKDFTINSLIDQKKQEAEIEMAAYLEKTALQKKQDEEELARIEELNKAKFQLAYDGLSLISELSSLFGEQDEKKARLAFQVDKAAKISSATIAGYEAVLEAYKTGQKSPLTVAFPAYPYVQAGLAGAFAAVNIAKIAKSKFQSSGGSMSTSGGGGGAAAGSGGMTAQFNTIGTSGINQLATLQQQPVQAYVVSGEVTSAQSLDRNRVQNATL